jgi:hypothetical protein
MSIAPNILSLDATCFSIVASKKGKFQYVQYKQKSYTLHSIVSECKDISKKFIFQQFLNIFFKNFYENVKNIAPPHYKALYLIIYKRDRIALKAGRAW